MPTEYASYLAAGILSDGRIITYRLLSRALKVHVNTAKEMMFEFHRIQNGKKPGTIHATYLLSGTKRRIEPTAMNENHLQEDNDMQNSPYMSSSMPQPEEQQEEAQIQTIILAREEHLEEARNLFEEISSIHVYSLEPCPLKDLHILSDATREIHQLTATEDPQEHISTYGTIQNKNVRRRKDRGPPPAILAAPVPVAKAKPATSSQTPGEDKPSEQSKPQSTSTNTKPEKGSSQSSAAKDFFAKKDADKKTAAASSSDQKPSSSNSKREKSKSNIFASFAKTKPKLKKEGTDSSAIASGLDSAASAQPSEAEDSPMKDVSDDDDEEDGYVLPVAPAPKENVDKDRKARKEREAALRQMMEDDDDDEEEEEKVPTPTAEPDEPLDAMQVDKPEEPIVVVEGGRRRGRRRIMKKKTIKDEEGYLVTKEEPVWESFSEDEPVAAKLKPKATISSSAGSGKAKKAAGKPEQGNIMSFFGKKP